MKPVLLAVVAPGDRNGSPLLLLIRQHGAGSSVPVSHRTVCKASGPRRENTGYLGKRPELPDPVELVTGWHRAPAIYHVPQKRRKPP